MPRYSVFVVEKVTRVYEVDADSPEAAKEAIEAMEPKELDEHLAVMPGDAYWAVEDVEEWVDQEVSAASGEDRKKAAAIFMLDNANECRQ